MAGLISHHTESALATPDCQACYVELLFKDSGSWCSTNSRISDVECKADSCQDVCVLFASATRIRECLPCRSHLSALLCIPSTFWTTLYRRSNGYFGCSETYSSDNTLESYSTWFRFIVKQMLDHPGVDGKGYIWHKMNIVTRWWPSGRNIIVCFDALPELKMRFPSPILNHPELDFRDPFWIHQQCVEEILALQDDSVWSIRCLVRKTEMDRTTLRSQPNPDYLHLHDIARHAFHSTETLHVAIKTLESIISQQYNFKSEHCGAKTWNSNISYRYRRNRLLHQLQMLTSLQYRSIANKDRLQSEITLAFNTVAQYDAKVSVRISHAAQRDSATMKTIAFVTTIFLPPTFICAIFSMTFFSLDSNDQGQPPKWVVSEKWWLYLATATPLTAITMIGVGLLWRRNMAINPM